MSARPMVEDTEQRRRIIDEILQANGHLPPPAEAFTAREYAARARERGGNLAEDTARLVLRREGSLRSSPFHHHGRETLFFWSEQEPARPKQEVIDEILEANGHLPPPAGSFTAKEYAARARDRGGEMSEGTARRLLKEMPGLEFAKYRYGGVEALYFWSKEVENSLQEGGAEE